MVKAASKVADGVKSVAAKASAELDKVLAERTLKTEYFKKYCEDFL